MRSKTPVTEAAAVEEAEAGGVRMAGDLPETVGESGNNGPSPELRAIDYVRISL